MDNSVMENGYEIQTLDGLKYLNENQIKLMDAKKDMAEFLQENQRAELVRQILNEMKSKNLTLGSCESLTAGLFCSTVASISGASAVLKGGLVTYFTQMKETLAHVPKEILETYGAVSAPCAFAMAVNARVLMDADIGVSFTGNAGPGAMEGKPAGLVYCALSTRKETEVFEYHYVLERNELRIKTVYDMLLEIHQKLDQR